MSRAATKPRSDEATKGEEKGLETLRRERRLALAVIRAEDIIRRVTGAICEIERVLLLPPDVHVLEVDYRMEYGGFLFLLAHWSFTPVPGGSRPPILFDTTVYCTMWYPEFMP